jgi:lipopolysaccharide export system protein LptA
MDSVCNRTKFGVPVVGILLIGLIVATAWGQDAGTMKQTVITSDNMSFDYKRLIAIFEDNVVVVDPQIRMESDRMNVLFTEENAVRSVTASGNVRMFSSGKTATCRRAIYVAHDSQVIMKGDVKLQQGRDTVEGNEITIWLDEDRMVVKPAKLIIMQGGGGNRSNPLQDLRRKPKKSSGGAR